MKVLLSVPFYGALLVSLMASAVDKKPADTTEEIFTKIYNQNLWGKGESKSGGGSYVAATRVIREEFPKIFKRYNIRTIADLPCGDWNWMRLVDFTGLHYIGGDIVKEEVERNRELYGKDNIHFEHLNIITDALPKVDLIFCRDTMQHLSQDQVKKALMNFKRSGSKYLLTTTYARTGKNRSVGTGGSAPYNLEIHPFNLPEPIILIDEKFQNKHLGLWLLRDLPNFDV